MREIISSTEFKIKTSPGRRNYQPGSRQKDTPALPRQNICEEGSLAADLLLRNTEGLDASSESISVDVRAGVFPSSNMPLAAKRGFCGSKDGVYFALERTLFMRESQATTDRAAGEDISDPTVVGTPQETMARMYGTSLSVEILQSSH